jgi:hypothetical protein
MECPRTSYSPTESSRIRLLELPNELLDRIASFTHDTDLLALAQVSYRLYKPSRRNTIWRVGGMKAVFAFLALLLRYPSIRQHLRAIAFDPLDPIAPSSPLDENPSHLRSLYPSLPPAATATANPSPRVATPFTNDFVFKLFTLVLEQCLDLRSLTIDILPSTYEAQLELVHAIGGLDRLDDLILGPTMWDHRQFLALEAYRVLLASFSRLRRLETPLRTERGESMLAEEKAEEASKCRIDHLRLELDDFGTLPFLHIDGDSHSSVLVSFPATPSTTRNDVDSTASVTSNQMTVIVARKEEHWWRGSARTSELLTLVDKVLEVEPQEVRVVQWGDVPAKERKRVEETLRRVGSRGPK